MHLTKNYKMIDIGEYYYRIGKQHLVNTLNSTQTSYTYYTIHNITQNNTFKTQHTHTHTHTHTNTHTYTHKIQHTHLHTQYTRATHTFTYLTYLSIKFKDTIISKMKYLYVRQCMYLPWILFCKYTVFDC